MRAVHGFRGPTSLPDSYAAQPTHKMAASSEQCQRNSPIFFSVISINCGHIAKIIADMEKTDIFTCHTIEIRPWVAKHFKLYLLIAIDVFLI